MCGKCIILTYDEVLEVVRDIEFHAPIITEPDWPARYPSAYPKSVVPVITAGQGVPLDDVSRMLASSADAQGALAVRELSWGFKESWKQGVVFNTRIESADKPTWRESMEERRCIIPVKAFFETSDTETVSSLKTGRPVKRQYAFEVSGEDIILIGGIWCEGAFSMVTTEPNAVMAPIHRRMPLVLRPGELPVWFGPDYRSLADRTSIPLTAIPSEDYVADSLVTDRSGASYNQPSLF